ncbi:MAG: cupin [Rhodospirillaceae bacterium]|jgi:quercetin dioxygenase-like cupin family protein|nr:cupin [Rhodospirillaceae bacterium]|tara:strand:- start:708 stop:1109 length:402 start_codon:yes stop_codon:yes gene_type:complete
MSDVAEKLPNPAEQFSVSKPETSGFEEGLRGYMVYRDLGIAKATGGKVLAHIVKARQAEEENLGEHFHTLDFQMVYGLKGWAKFWYEGVGEVLIEPGTCIYQPPGIRHCELAHSADFEVLEICMPADFGTSNV